MRLALALLSLAVALPSRGQNPGAIVITEVMVNPGGTITDANGEWVELYNMTFAPIDVGGWVVRDSAAPGVRPPFQLPVGTVIPAGRFFVLGNTVNTTLNGGVPVSYAYGGAMNLTNSVDRVQVFRPDPAGTVQIAAPSPYAGTYVLIDEAYFRNASISAQNGVSRERTSILVNSTVADDNMDSAAWQDALVTDVYGGGGRGTPGSAGSTTLPVELVAFRAVASGTAARLSWTTASETNNAGFAVERQTGETWADVGFVAGHGTSAERHSYTFEVTGLTAGRHTFRLRQTDTDGAVHASAPVSVEVGVDGAEGRVTLLGQRAVRIETNQAQAVEVTLYDVTGRQLLRERMDVQGTREVAVPASMAAGVYVLRVQGSRFAETRTLVVR